MKPLNPWLVFRSLSIACLVAVALVIIYFVYVARVPALEAFGVTVQLVLPATVLFLIGLSIDRSFHFSDRIAARYGYQRIGIVCYILLALAVGLSRSAMNHYGTVVTTIVVVGSLLPGLLLGAWWGLHKVIGQQPGKS